MPSGPGNIGEYWLPILPSIEGIGPEIDRKLGRAFDGVSKQASNALAEGVRDGVKAAEAAVKKSSDAIAKLRDKEADAAGKVRVAEERLAEVREKGGSTAARAQEAHARALRQQASVLRDVESQTKSLESAQQRLARAQKDAADGPSRASAGSWLDAIKSKAGDAADALQGIGDSAVGGMESSGDGAGSAFVAGFAGQVSKIGGKAGPIGIAITAAAAVALAGGKLIADQVFAGMEQEQQRANIQAKLGVDAATMERIGSAAAAAYTKNFGESVAANMDTARAAIQAGLLDPGASSGQTAAMIAQLSTVADVLGEDIPNVARSASQAIRTGMAPDAVSAFDLIVKGQQAGLNASEDWLDTLNEYSTQFRKLGLDGVEATGLISQMVKGGARDTDVAADALKEFSIRIVDGSEGTVTALTDLGYAGEGAINGIVDRFAQGGPIARDALDEIIDRLRGVQDPLLQGRIAVGLFGTQAEDLGAALNSMDLSTAVGQLGQVEGAAQQAADTVGGTASSSWASMQRTVEVAVDGMQQQLAGVFGPTVADVANTVTAHQDDIIGFFTRVGTVAIEFGASMLDFAGDFTNSFAGVVNAIGDTHGAVTRVSAAIARLTGDTEKADRLDAEADAAFGLADGLYATSDALKGAADKSDDWQSRLEAAGRVAADNARLNQALGNSVLSIPDGKNIIITDNTPETTQRLRDLGIEVEQTPTGLRITATTDEAEAIVNAWRQQQGLEPLPVNVEPKIDPEKARAEFERVFGPLRQQLLGGANGVTPPGPNAPGAAPGASITELLIPQPRAAGGVFAGMQSLPADAMIQPPVTGGVVQWAEAGDPEAFIPINDNPRSKQIWLETGRRLGMLQSFANGGLGDAGGMLPFTEQMRELIFAQFPAVRDIGGYRAPDGYNEHSSGRAADVMIPNYNTPEGIALGNQVANFALSLPGVERIMWRAKLIYRNGKIEDAGGRGSDTANHMDHVHIFANDQAAQATTGAAPNLSGFGSAGGAVPSASMHGMSGAIGSMPGFGGGSSYAPSAGTPGVDPETGESGYYVPDAKDIADKQRRVTEADARVREEEAALRELKADAKESERIRADNQLAKARADADEARAELAEAQRGKFTAGDTADSGSSKGKLDPVGGIVGSFFKETFGFDGSLFPDLSELGVVKMFNAIAGIKYEPQGKGFPWQVGYPGGNGSPWSGDPFGGQPMLTSQAASGLPFGMIPAAIPNAAGVATPNMAPPGTPASGIGTGPAPGPVDNSKHVAVTVNGIDENKVADNVRRQILNVDRLHTYTPPGIG